MNPEPSLRVTAEHEQIMLVDINRRNDTATVEIFVSGEVESTGAVQLSNVVCGAVRQYQPDCIEMNLSGITFLGSAGIRALVVCHADAQQAGCQLRLVDPPVIVYRVLEICGLVAHFELQPPV
jgi:anti-anti-sigma factor